MGKVYPIVMYGHPILRRRAKDVAHGQPELRELIEDMFSTMKAAQGVGLAAPQIGKDLRLFVVDDEACEEDAQQATGLRMAFINPQIVGRSELVETMEEGCLSIPGIRQDVTRLHRIQIRYYDADWILREATYEGLQARIVQHEYDHIEGILFIDHINPLKKRLLKRQLGQISKGDVDAAYQILIPR